MSGSRSVLVLGVVLATVGALAAIGQASGPASGPPPVAEEAKVLREAQEECSEREPHPPIEITEEHGLRGATWTNPATGETEYRPGSGVTAGSGTAEDPYVITGWCIHEPTIAIQIEDVDAHFLVEDNVLLGFSGALGNGGGGLSITDTGNITVRGNHIVNNAVGIDAYNSMDLTIEDNLIGLNIDGIQTYQIAVPRFDGHADDPRIQGNTLVRNERGMYVASEDALVADNVVRDGRPRGVSPYGYGIRFPAFDSGSVAVNNTVIDNQGRGFLVNGHNEGLIANNTIRGNDVGIELAWQDPDSLTFGLGPVFVVGPVRDAAENNTIADNTITENGVGAEAVGDVPNSTLRHNDIHDNADGVGLDATQANHVVDARYNWWGCSDGPDASGCDEAVGTVLYEPWLSHPAN